MRARLYVWPARPQVSRFDAVVLIGAEGYWQRLEHFRLHALHRPLDIFVDHATVYAPSAMLARKLRRTPGCAVRVRVHMWKCTHMYTCMPSA